MPWATEKRDVSSANSIMLQDKPFGKSRMQLKNKIDGKQVHGEFLQSEEDWLWSTTLSLLLVKSQTKLEAANEGVL